MPKAPLDSDEKRTTSTTETLADWIEQRVSGLSELYTAVANGENPITFISTGLERLDKAGLWELGVLHSIIGHEGDGKTTLLVQAAESAAKAGHRVQLYMPEDPREMIADRVLAPILDCSAFDIRRLKLSGPRSIPGRLQAAKVAANRWAKNISVFDNIFDRGINVVKRMTSLEFEESLYDRYSDEQPDLVGWDYAQIFGAEKDEKSVERVIAQLVWKFNTFCKNPTRSKSKAGPPPDFKVAGVLLSQVGSHVKRRGIDWYNDEKRNARFNNKDGHIKPDVTWIEGFRPLPGDAQWAPTALCQQSRVVLSILCPNDILTTMGVSGLEDNVMEVLPIKNNYSRKPKMIRLKFDGSRARLGEFPIKKD